MAADNNIIEFPDDARSAAERYLTIGLAPIPLLPRSKDPAYPGWAELRVTHESLDQHFPANQAQEVGVLNGGPSGNIVDVHLDCDQARRAATVLLPPTEWRFGRRSAPQSHWIYQSERPLNNAQEKYCDLDDTTLLELGGTGGHTVFPPSTDQDTGDRIVWDRFSDVAQVNLDELRTATTEAAAVALLARHWPVELQSRADAFLAVVGSLLRAGWVQTRTERFLSAIAVATSDEDMHKRFRIRQVMTIGRDLEQDPKTTSMPKLAELLGKSGHEVLTRAGAWLSLNWQAKPRTPLRLPSQTAQQPPRKLEPYRPFPLEALPAPLAEYVRQAAEALGCDPTYLALPALAVLASCIGNTRTILLKRGWAEPSIVWTAIVGDSGTLKSPAYERAVAPLFDVQRQLMQEYQDRVGRYQIELADYQVAKRGGREGDGTRLSGPPEKPVLSRPVCSDTTVEKLAEILDENPRGTLMARDELAGWLGSFTRYRSSPGGSDLPNWLEMHRAGTVMVDRKTGERTSLFIARAAVSVTGSIQPGVLARALTQEFYDAGLPARLLMAMPPKVAKRWSEAVVAQEVEDAYRVTIDRLLALEFRTEGKNKVPHPLPLSPAAKAAWVAFYDTWAQEQAAVEGELAAAFSKLEAYAARFALLHHVISHVGRGADDLVPVEQESIEAGVALCRWFAAEARRIYSAIAASEEERTTRRLIEFIRSHGGKITVKQLQRSNQHRYQTSEQAQAALQALVNANVGRWEDRPHALQGGRPTRDFVLNVTDDETDETDDDEEDDGGGSGTGPPDETPPPPNGTCRLSDNNGVSSVSSSVTRDETGSPTIGQAENPPAAGSSRPVEVSSHWPAYLLVQDQAELERVGAALNGALGCAVALRTTGPDPRRDRVRLLSLAPDTTDERPAVYVVDCLAVEPAPLWESLAERQLVMHGGASVLAFLGRLGFTPAGPVKDTMLLAQLLTAGTSERVNLAACCERYLGRHLDEAKRQFDWSDRLTGDQLGRAALDVEVLFPLLTKLTERINRYALASVADIEQRCLLTVVWMGRHGVALDRARWESLARTARDEAHHLHSELDRVAPPKPGRVANRWNWDSPQQAQQALALAGCSLPNTNDDTLVAVDHPVARLLRRYRVARQRVSTYGAGWPAHLADDGRVYPSWRQIGAVSGRMSCSDPNVQQLPRGEYRTCVVAPPGRVLVKADYSQIELRIAAKVAGEKALLAAFERGDDLHTVTARNVLRIDEVTKQQRQLAKALNFGLLYGMGARGFLQYAKSQYGLELTEDEARRYRSAFFQTYPGLADWHRRVRAGKSCETRTLTGRRRVLDDRTSDTQRLNTPVQGTGADGLKLALAHLWERREQAPGTFPVLAVHDEIVVEADTKQADAVARWLEEAMVDAMGPMIAPVPVEVEVKIGASWGGD